MENKYEYLDDEFASLPRHEKIIRGGKRDREQGSLTNLMVYGTNRRNSARNEFVKLQRKLARFERRKNES